MRQAEPAQFRAASAVGQYAALCWREGPDGVEVLMITSRETRRWVIPKGWPIAGLSPHQAAAREAWEEAGVTGEAMPAPIGSYSYDKRRAKDASTVVVAVHPLKVAAMQDAGFPEAGQRKRVWVPPARAATMVDEPGLADLLAGFDPARIAS